MKIRVIIIAWSAFVSLSLAFNVKVLSNFTVNVVKTQQAVIVGCDDSVLHKAGKALITWNQHVILLNLKNNYSLENALTRQNHARTSVILDCSCLHCLSVLESAAQRKYFNKTYQWMIWDPKSRGLSELIGHLKNIGPNTQLTYVNTTANSSKYSLYDVHSKGRHLNAPIIVTHFADWQAGLSSYHNVQDLQGIRHRDQFHGLTLRVGTVIDRDNITSNEHMEIIHSSSMEKDGVPSFIKYHYDLLLLLRERLNFTTNYRNVRGWAGRLGGNGFRLGFLGIVSRNEVDIGTSGSLNRINRFAEFDTIHQSWKFETAFLYRFTTDVVSGGGSGNFLTPFTEQVWLISGVVIVLFVIFWRLVVCLRNYDKEEVGDSFFLSTLAAICQQGLDPIPRSLPARTILLTMFVFSLVMYNYYTSSVVGGLLSSSGQGPKTLTEIVNSPLKLSFEDIGYYKVLFKERRFPIIEQMYRIKLLPRRNADDLPVFVRLKSAIPYVKKGGYAFQCELVDAYPEIARLFDADEVCDLRIVSGLLETEVLNWIITKNSMYTELFKILMCRARETGLVVRAGKVHRPEKPACQSAYTVYPVTMSGVLSAFALLGVGMLASSAALFAEVLLKGNEREKQTL